MSQAGPRLGPLSTFAGEGPAGWVTKRHDGTAAITSRAIAESGTAELRTESQPSLLLLNGPIHGAYSTIRDPWILPAKE